MRGKEKSDIVKEESRKRADAMKLSDRNRVGKGPDDRLGSRERWSALSLREQERRVVKCRSVGLGGGKAPSLTAPNFRMTAKKKMRTPRVSRRRQSARHATEGGRKRNS